MIRRVAFSGGSDDLVEIAGAPGCDEVNKKSLSGEWNVLSDQQGKYSGAWDVISGSNRVRVHAIYDGCWSFAAGKVDEDDDWPGWEIVTTQAEACSYSTELQIEAPDDARVEHVG